MGVLLQVTDITKFMTNQPKPGLDGVSFEVNEGEFLGIMGSLRFRENDPAECSLHNTTPPTSGKIDDGPDKYPEVEPNAGGGLPQKQPWLYFPRILPFGQLDSPGKYRRSVDITA